MAFPDLHLLMGTRLNGEVVTDDAAIEVGDIDVSLSGEGALELAAGIVRAVNAHDDLVAALKEVSAWISNWDPSFTQDEQWPETKAQIAAALAKAEAN